MSTVPGEPPIDPVCERSREERVTEALYAIRALSDALDRMNGSMKSDMDMNATDLGAVRMLIIREQRGDSVSPHDVARHLGISTASTTKLLDRLTDAGFVERHPHPHDRRARVVVLTEHSRQMFFRHFGDRLQAMRDVAAGFEDAELRAITRFIDGLSVALAPR